MKCVQGKSIVNSISLEVGEEELLRQAKLCMRYGAGVVIMAFDEQGQAATFEERVRICLRNYRVLRQKIDFPPEDIIFCLQRADNCYRSARAQLLCHRLHQCCC